MPQIWNPPCGWLFSANATPFNITDETCNQNRSEFSETFGIEDRITNRSRRALALLGPDAAISREELLTYRADTKYDPASDLMQLVVEMVTTQTEDETLKQAQEILRNWDGDTGQESRGYNHLDDSILNGVRSTGLSAATLACLWTERRMYYARYMRTVTESRKRVL